MPATKSEHLAKSFPFLQRSKHWNGAVEIIHSTDEEEKEHIYLRLRIKRVTIRLPRAGLLEVIDALNEAHQEASQLYAKLIEKMNRG